MMDVDNTPALTAIDIFVYVFFIVDIFLNFIKAYWDREQACMVTDRKAIAYHYLTHWFFVDLIASIPIDLFLSEDQGGALNQVARIARLPRAIRFLRLLRLLKLLRSVNWLDLALRLWTVIYLPVLDRLLEQFEILSFSMRSHSLLFLPQLSALQASSLSCSCPSLGLNLSSLCDLCPFFFHFS